MNNTAFIIALIGVILIALDWIVGFRGNSRSGTARGGLALPLVHIGAILIGIALLIFIHN